MYPRYLTATEIAGSPANALFLLVCRGYQNQWWQLGGYGSDLEYAKVWARDDALAILRQGHERDAVGVSAEPFLWQHGVLAEQAFRIWRGRESKLHELKIWSEPFAAIVAGAKRAEIRRDDRGFEAGDMILLREWILSNQDNSSKQGRYTGQTWKGIITHVLRDNSSGIQPGFAMLSVLSFPV